MLLVRAVAAGMAGTAVRMKRKSVSKAEAVMIINTEANASRERGSPSRLQ